MVAIFSLLISFAPSQVVHGAEIILPSQSTPAQQQDSTSPQETAALLKFLSMMGGGGLSGGPGGTAHSSESYPTDVASWSGQYYGPGKMEVCIGRPAEVDKALAQAMDFRAHCALANRGEGQKIAINDYAATPPYMYIFDASGKCLGRTMVTFGNGAGGKMACCSDNGSHLTPPGFHLTARQHDGGEYNSGNSLKLVGLEGQGTSDRGVLIHPAQAPGTGTSWGCSGVGFDAINAVKTTLGEGALVYNYFQPDALSPSCRSHAGMSHGTACQKDPDTPAIPANATGIGTPQVK